MILQPLTKKEKQVLEFIEDFLREHEMAPSYQEIKKHFQFASFNSVQRYLKQLQAKRYIYIPGGNQKRAISLLHSARAAVPTESPSFNLSPHNSFVSSMLPKRETPMDTRPAPVREFESLSLPLLGRVAAGLPIEAMEHDEFIDVPFSLVRDPRKSFALKVEGQSMIEDGILDNDVILIQKQSYANNGDIIVATVENEATVKRYFFHQEKTSKDSQKQSQSLTESVSGLQAEPYPVALRAESHPAPPQVELRPANSNMQSMWYPPDQVQIRGIVVGLIRRF